MPKKEKTIVAQSPGRINIIGEHTDYNQGFVLPAAIDKKTVFHLQKNATDDSVHVTANNVNEQFYFDLNSFKPVTNGWQNYVMGVVHELQKLGANLSGFNARFAGDVPIGSGMSSSASLECSLAIGLNELFNLGFDKWQLIKAAQMAEHHFVNTKCGIMDQFASIMGKKNKVMLLDCQSLAFEYFPFDLGAYQILLLNTNVSHTLSSSAYNNRIEECESGVSLISKQFPEVKSLRDVTRSALEQCSPALPDKIFKRCQHVVTENIRVKEATKALLGKDFRKLGKLIYESHDSLQHNYEVSCPELDYLVQYTRDKDYVLGSRMMGGGFGGCTINIVEKKWVNNFIEQTARSYRNHFGFDLSPYEVSIENGADIDKNHPLY